MLKSSFSLSLSKKDFNVEFDMNSLICKKNRHIFAIYTLDKKWQSLILARNTIFFSRAIANLKPTGIGDKPKILQPVL